MRVIFLPPNTHSRSSNDSSLTDSIITVHEQHLERRHLVENLLDDEIVDASDETDIEDFHQWRPLR